MVFCSCGAKVRFVLDSLIQSLQMDFWWLRDGFLRFYPFFLGDSFSILLTLKFDIIFMTNLLMNSWELHSCCPSEDWQLLEEVDASDQHGRSLRALAVPPCSLIRLFCFCLAGGSLGFNKVCSESRFFLKVVNLKSVSWCDFGWVIFTERLFFHGTNYWPQILGAPWRTTYIPYKLPAWETTILSHPSLHPKRQWDPNGIKLAVASFDVTCRCRRKGGKVAEAIRAKNCQIASFRWICEYHYV